MITEEDVYVAYRRAKSLQSGKGFRLPKHWDTFFVDKMSQKNREYLTRAAGFFNTTWSNVNLDKYMSCGAELYKTFSYHMFLRPNILTHYIEKDKIQKRKVQADILLIDASFNYIIGYLRSEKMGSRDYTDLEFYCKLKEGDKKSIVGDYLSGHIDSVLLTYCIYYKYIKLTDIEREYCYNVVNRYRDFLQQMFDVEDFIKSKDK